MGDLTDDELDSIERSLGGPTLVATSKSETCRMVAELRRHRAAQAADAKAVRGIVIRAINDLSTMGVVARDRIADRVAGQVTPKPAADAVRVREVVREVVRDECAEAWARYDDGELDREGMVNAIADRVAAQLTNPDGAP